jgi:outer membrane biosynthesis protein TonB
MVTTVARAFSFSLLLVMSPACQHFLQEESNAPERPMLEPDLVTKTTEVSTPEAPASSEPEREPPPHEPAIQSTGEPTRGKLSKAAIEAGVQPGIPAFEACLARALDRRPELQGTIVVNFVVAPDGSVPYAAALEQGTTLTEDPVVDCVLNEFQKLRFEAPVGGRAVATYPLTFAPKPAP